MWLKILGIMGIVLLVALSGFYLYYRDSQSKIMTLQASNATLQMAIKTNEDTINALQLNYQQAAQELANVNAVLTDTRTQNKELQMRLSEHDLGALAAAKPGLVQNIINDATRDANRCFELLSGAPLTTKERTAKNAKEFNNECPWMFNDSTAD